MVIELVPWPEAIVAFPVIVQVYEEAPDCGVTLYTKLFPAQATAEFEVLNTGTLTVPEINRHFVFAVTPQAFPAYTHTLYPPAPTGSGP